METTELTTDQEGALAEAKIATAAIAGGIGVYRPLFEGGRYDLIFDLGRRLLRIQCKWAVLVDDYVIARLYSARRAPEGMRVRKYTAAEIDVVALYCAAIDQCFFRPARLFDGKRQVHLRLRSCRNNQRRGINWASEFALESLHLNARQGP